MNCNTYFTCIKSGTYILCILLLNFERVFQPAAFESPENACVDRKA